MYYVRPELLILNPLMDHQQSVKYKSTRIKTIANSTHSNFFKGQTDRGLFYWPNHSGETPLSKLEEEGTRTDLRTLKIVMLFQWPVL